MILTGLIFGLLSFAQNPNTAVFPGGIVNDNNLFVAKDLASSILTSNITSSQLVVPVTAGSVFVAPSLVTIDNETISICSISSNTLNVCAGGRGFNNTSAASHVLGKVVYAGISSYYFNQLAAEVKAIEGYVANEHDVKADIYNFHAQNPSGALIVGSNTITLSPCPLGVNGTDVGHNLYITDVVANSEYGLITGGTCTSGAATGTVILTLAHSHSNGNWSIGSATGGGQEALETLGANGGTLAFPFSTPSIFKGPLNIYGQNINITGNIDCQIDSGTCINFDGSQVPVSGIAGGNSIKNLILQNSSATSGTDRTGIVINSQNSFLVDNAHLTFMDNGIKITDAATTFRVQITNSSVSYIKPTTGVGVYIDALADVVMHNDYITGIGVGSGQPCKAAIQIQDGGGLYFSSIDGLNCTNNLLINPDTTQHADFLFCNTCVFDAAAADSVYIHPTNGGYLSSATFSNSWTSSGTSNGLNCAPDGSSFVMGLSLNAHKAFNNGQNGVLIQSGCYQTTISNSYFSQNSSSTLGTTPLYDGIQVGNNVNGILIDGNWSGQLANFLNIQRYGINIVGPADTDVTVLHNTVLAENTGGTAPGQFLNDGSTASSKIIKDNSSNPVVTIASAATISLGATDPEIVNLTGTATIGTISGGWTNRKISIIKADTGTATVGSGSGNVSNVVSLPQGGIVSCTWANSFWWCK